MAADPWTPAQRWFLASGALLTGTPAACSAALGAWICSPALTGGRAPRPVGELLAAAGAGIDDDALAGGGDHLLAILATAALDGGAAARRVGDWLERSETPAHLRAAGALLGLCDEPSAVPAPPADPWTLIGAPRAELRAACWSVFAATRFGTRRARVDPRIGQALRPVALETLRAHDLELGATLTRALLYAGGADMTTTVRFLEARQRPDGGFGHLAPECAAAESMPGVDPVADLELPTALAAVWTLAEAGLRVRVLRRPGRPSRPARARAPARRAGSC